VANGEDLPCGIIGFALYDGHGGVRCAEFASKHLLRAIGDFITKEQQKSAGAPTLSDTTLKRCIKDAFLKIDQEFLESARIKNLDDGSTAIIILVMEGTKQSDDEDSSSTHGNTTVTSSSNSSNHQQKIIVANLGDSRAVMCRGGRALR
jgi:serine/threonine protein phosphatase PrpC